MIEWEHERFSVGHPLMDQQHRQIIEIINQLVVKGHAGEVEEEEIYLALVEMNEYAMTHFQAEENLIALHVPELLEEQVLSHRMYEERVRALVTGKSDVIAKLVSTLDFLLDWWEQHILVEDRQYRDQLLYKE